MQIPLETLLADAPYLAGLNGRHGDWLAAHIPGVEVFANEFGHFGDDAGAERELAWLTDQYRGAS